MTEIDVTGRSVHALPVWGWEIPTYLFFGGVTAGIMIVAALMPRLVPPERQSKWMRCIPFLAPVVLSAGMLALFLDLESKLHVFRFYTAFRVTSPMSWGSWILVLIYPATLLLGVVRVTDRFRTHATAIERANLLLGIALGAYTGILLATLSARALWGSALLGPLFLISGLSTGAALILLLPISGEEHEAVRRIDVMAVGAELVVLALFFVHLASGGARSRAAARLFLGGDWTAPFWTLVVIAGLLVPLALELFESKFHLRRAAIAPLLLLTGGFALRWVLVAAGQAL